MDIEFAAMVEINRSRTDFLFQSILVEIRHRCRMLQRFAVAYSSNGWSSLFTRRLSSSGKSAGLRNSCGRCFSPTLHRLAMHGAPKQVKSEKLAGYLASKET